MKRILLSLTAVALAASGPAFAAQSDVNAKGQAELAKMIAGRTPGKEMSCIPARLDTRLHIIDHTAIVYDSGNTVYVAKPDDPNSLDTNDILVINRFGSQLCNTDIIRTVDRVSGFQTGVVFLGKFVPYTKK